MHPEETVALLQICDLSKQWPGTLSALHDNAMAALLEANEEAKEAIAERNAAKAKAQASADARAKADREREAALAEAMAPRVFPTAQGQAPRPEVRRP